MRKNMTVGVLLKRLNALLASGAVKSDTPVCGFADEFQRFYRLGADVEIAYETAPLIDECLDFVRRHENSQMPRSSVERKKKDAAMMRRLGRVVVCLDDIG